MSKIFIVAGEASGDIIGGKLIKALLEREPNLSFAGVGGTHMEDAGLHSLLPMRELSIMGIAEVIPHYFRLRRCFKQVLEAAQDLQPDLVITIDSPGFNFRLVRQLRNLLPARTKFVQYVAPSVWAYKPKRAQTVAELYDHILLLLPFEKPYFDKVGIANTFVGHPVLEQEIVQPTAEFLEKFGLSDQKQGIIVMPGSRETEVALLLPIFVEALKRIKGNYIYFVPTMPHLVDKIMMYADNVPIITIVKPEEKWQAIAASRAALVKSGTSTVELMAYNIPMVVAYKVHWLTALYIKHHVRIKYASLINLLLGKEAIPELLMEQCTSENISRKLQEILTNLEQRNAQLIELQAAMGKLAARRGPSKPSTVAADVVLKMLKQPSYTSLG